MRRQEGAARFSNILALLAGAVLVSACERSPFRTDVDRTAIEELKSARLCVVSVILDPQVRLHGLSVLENVIHEALPQSTPETPLAKIAVVHQMALEQSIDARLGTGSCASNRRSVARVSKAATGDLEATQIVFERAQADYGIVASAKLWMETIAFNFAIGTIAFESDVSVYSKALKRVWTFKGYSSTALAGLRPNTWMRGLGSTQDTLAFYEPHLAAYSDFAMMLLADDIANRPHKTKFTDYRSPPQELNYIAVANATETPSKEQ